MPTIGIRRLSAGLRLLTDLLLLLNLIALVLLPFLLKAVFNNPALLAPFDGPGLLSSLNPAAAGALGYPADVPPGSYSFYLAFLYATGISIAWVLAEGHFILRRLEHSQPFAKGNAGSFRRMAGAFMLLTLAFAVKIARYNTLLTVFCALLFVVLSVICLIFADIFHQAWLVKTENELTI